MSLIGTSVPIKNSARSPVLSGDKTNMSKSDGNNHRTVGGCHSIAEEDANNIKSLQLLCAFEVPPP